MLLNGRERLVLLNSVVPQEGNLLTMKLMSDLRDALQLDEAELKQLNVTSPTQPMSWDVLEKLPDKEIEIGKVTKNELVTALNKLNTEKKVTPQHLSLFEKFGATGG